MKTLDPSLRLWFYGNDFNEFLWDHENEGGNTRSLSRPRFLNVFMTKMELIDLGFNGPRFTWRRTCNNSLVQERLDRGFVNGP